MWTDDDGLEALEAYSEGRMSGPESNEFEQRLRTEPDLAAQLARYRDTRKAIVQHNEDERVRHLLERTEVRQQNWTGPWWRWATAAAVIACLSAAAWWLIGRTPGLPTLAEEFSVSESPLPVFMSAEGSTHMTMDEAMQAYGSGDFATAVECLRQLPSSDTSLFFTGLSQLRLGQDGTASLRVVFQRPDSPYCNRAGYHLLIQATRASDAVLAQHLWKAQAAVTGHPYRAQLEAIGEKTGWRP